MSFCITLYNKQYKSKIYPKWAHVNLESDYTINMTDLTCIQNECVNLESHYITNGTEVTRIQNDHMSILYLIIL